MSTYTPQLHKPDRSLTRILASAALARVVTHFVLHPRAAHHFRALQRITGLPSRSLQHELARLAEWGMVQRERDGRVVRHRAILEHPRWRVLRDLVREFAEPAEVLRAALAEVSGVEAAFIYGSCVRRTEVHPASDIDVFVVGEAMADPETRFALAEATLEASGLLGREINVTRYTPAKLAARQARGARFVRSVLAGPKEWLVRDEASLTEVFLAPDRDSMAGAA